jgi:hypothetical protein
MLNVSTATRAGVVTFITEMADRYPHMASMAVNEVGNVSCEYRADSADPIPAQAETLSWVVVRAEYLFDTDMIASFCVRYTSKE